MIPGTRIRYTMGNLGLIGHSGLVQLGDEGTIIGPGPDEGWIYTEPDAHPGQICPVSAGMIEDAARHDARLTADALGWATTGSLNSRSHLAIIEPYQTVALCGVGIAMGGTFEARPAERSWCRACVRRAKVEGVRAADVGIENDLRAERA